MLNKLRSYIPGINTALFISTFFFLPMHVAPAYIATCLMLLLCLAEGDFRKKWQKLKSNPLFWIFQAFFWIFPLSLLWTDDLDAGFKMVGRYAFFLLSPVYLLIARRDLIDRCITSFLAGCALTELLAYYNWLQIHLFTDWPSGPRVTRLRAEGDTAPFVDRIMYAPILAWAAYLGAKKSLTSSGIQRIGYAIFTLSSIINLVISGGRTGQLAFLVLLVVFIFQSFSKSPTKAAIVSITLVSSIAIGSYSTSSFMKHRVDMAVDEVLNYTEKINTSAGLRITYYINSIRIFKENPFFGVGAGDFETAYEKVNSTHSPEWWPTPNPHNQYLFVLTTTGLIGGALLLLVLFPPSLWRQKNHSRTNSGLALVVFIATINILESYLWRSNTSLLYVVFAILLSQKAQINRK